MLEKFKARLLVSTMAMAILGASGHAAIAETPDGPVQTADANSVETVTVTGKKVASQATADEMQAVATTNELTPDEINRVPDSNVADILSRLPGINVMDTNNLGGSDVAARGEGQFVSLRGLNGEFNVNQIDGVNVAEGQPYSREVNLNLLPPTGLQHIVVSKVSSADMDGDAIGGTVDFRTPTAFDFAEPYAGSVTVGGQYETRAADYGKNPGGGNFSGEFADKFGPDDSFGLYVGGYYGLRNYTNSETDDHEGYALRVQTAKGASPAGLEPDRNLVETGFDAAFATGQEERYGGNVSLDWKPDSTTLGYARFTYAEADTTDAAVRSQLAGDYGYTTNSNGTKSLNFTGITPQYWYETAPESDKLLTSQIGLDKTIGDWTLSPNVFFSYGEANIPNHIEISSRYETQPGTPIPVSGIPITYSNDYPIALLGKDGFAALSGVNDYIARRFGQQTDSLSTQVRGGGKFDATYDIKDGIFDFIKFGAKYEASDRQFTHRDWEIDPKITTGQTFGSLGLISSYITVNPGVYDWVIPLLNQQALVNQFNAHDGRTYKYLDTCQNSIAEGGNAVNAANNWSCDTMRGSENVTSAYVMGNLKIDDIEIIPGLRFEHTDIGNTFFVSPTNSAGVNLPGYFSSNSTSYDEPLPSLLVNYRPDEHSVYRADVWVSYTRPSLYQLSGSETVSIGDTGTTITEGNPNLKVVHAVNEDISGSWDSGHGGEATVAAFYKQLSNYIYDDGANLINTALAPDGNISINRPTNGGSAHLYGIELGAIQEFRDMPEPLNGFGVAGNVTWEHSQAQLNTVGLNSLDQMQDAPNWTANLQAFYEQGPVKLDVSYKYAGWYIATYGIGTNVGTASALDTWVHPHNQVDLHAAYSFSNGLTANFSATNLFDTNSYYATVGKNGSVVDTLIDSGQTFSASLKYAF